MTIIRQRHSPMRAISALAWLFAAVLLALPGHLCAALAWDQQEQTAIPAIADKNVRFAYKFTNTGATPLTITNVKTSCSCTAAKLGKSTYAPGETGVLNVTFTIGTRTGSHTKTITVTTDDAASPRSLLTLHVKIPPQAEFSRRVATWLLNASPDPQAITVTIPATVNMTITGVSVMPGQGPPCTVALAADPDVDPATGHGFTVTITPKSTAAVGTTTIEVKTSLKSYHIYARVITPMPPRPTTAVPAAGTTPTAPGPQAAGAAGKTPAAAP